MSPKPRAMAQQRGASDWIGCDKVKPDFPGHQLVCGLQAHDGRTHWDPISGTRWTQGGRQTR